jgi:hypothetical protein
VEKRLRQICSEVLFYVWDPIGVRLSAAARDEYDPYADKVAEYLAEGQNAKKIADYLAKVRTTSIGLDPAPKQDMMVAELLIDWRESLQDGIA